MSKCPNCLFLLLASMDEKWNGADPIGAGWLKVQEAESCSLQVCDLELFPKFSKLQVDTQLWKEAKQVPSLGFLFPE